jgi:hypothetical protein
LDYSFGWILVSFFTFFPYLMAGPDGREDMGDGWWMFVGDVVGDENLRVREMRYEPGPMV